MDDCHILSWGSLPGRTFAVRIDSGEEYLCPAAMPPHYRKQPVNTRTTPPSILLIEDNPGDVRLALEALSSWRIPPTIRVASDGPEALRILAGSEAGDKMPDLILLDLNLPGVSGREVLREVKSSSTLGRIPVIVLSSSDSEEDVDLAYSMHANCYLVKPVYLDEYLEVVRAIDDFWISHVRLGATAA